MRTAQLVHIPKFSSYTSWLYGQVKMIRIVYSAGSTHIIAIRLYFDDFPPTSKVFTKVNLQWIRCIIERISIDLVCSSWRPIDSVTHLSYIAHLQGKYFLGFVFISHWEKIKTLA